MRRKPENPFWVFLALIFLLEAWLWDHLAPLVRAVVNIFPWKSFKAQLKRLFNRLPPWVALIVFALPLVAVAPIKFLEVWFLAHGSWIGVVVTLVLAKLIGLGVTAFIFDVTRQKLLQLAWFRRLYDYVMWLRDWAHAMADPIMHRIQTWRRVLTRQRFGRFWRRVNQMRARTTF
jgi:hypothetical protein